MLPDSKIATNGFHDVVIENLAASPIWRLWYIFSGCHLSSSTMAEGRFQNDAEMIEGGGETPSVGSSSTRVGVSA